MCNERNNEKIWACKSIKKSSTSTRHAEVQKVQIIVIIIIICVYYYYYYHPCFFASNRVHAVLINKE